MKMIHALLWPLLLLSHATAAETGWRKAAREFMAGQDFAPIEIKPGTRFETDRARPRFAWMQRVLMPAFEKHLEKWPQYADAARSFAKQALMIKAGHPDVDRSRPWEVLAQEGTALIRNHVDDPLILWLTAAAVWEFREGTHEARDHLSKASRHRMIRDYPSVLPSYIQAELRDIAIQRYSSQETISRINLALFN